MLDNELPACKETASPKTVSDLRMSTIISCSRQVQVESGWRGGGGGRGGVPDVHQLLSDAAGQQHHLQVVLPQVTKVGQLEAVGLLHRQGVLAGERHQARDGLEGNEGGRAARRLGDAVQHLHHHSIAPLPS